MVSKQKCTKKKDLKLRKYIINKIKEKNLIKKTFKTHIDFNNKILNLLKDKDLKNFLRKNFIQKMFFLQNRFFIYQEFKKMKKSKKWRFYENLLKEDNIGNPI